MVAGIISLRTRPAVKSMGGHLTLRARQIKLDYIYSDSLALEASTHVQVNWKQPLPVTEFIL